MALVDTSGTLAGLDALATTEIDERSAGGFGRRAWSAAWPKLLAVGVALAVWQLVVASGWKPDYVLPGPRPVLGRFVSDLSEFDTWRAIATTLRRALTGFALAIVVGGGVGLAVSRSLVLRRGIGMLITGMQTMPSIAWFPLALILFKLSEGAMLFVVVIGASPSIANGVIAGIDHVPPLFTRAGRSLGARGWSLYRHVVVPAALPAVVAGLKQGWAFAWRSLLAGELLVILANQPSLGTTLEFNRQFSDTEGLISTMLIILVIGVLIEGLIANPIERALRRRRGLS